MSLSRRPGAMAAALLTALLACLVFANPSFAGGEHGGHGPSKPLPPDADRCDLGFNTKAYNDIVRTGTADDKKYAGAAFKRLFMAPLTWQQTLSLNKQTFMKATYGWIASQQMLDGRKKVGHLGHSLVDPWEGITDPVVCNKLKNQLTATQAYAAKYPTLGDALDDGFEYITPWFAGAGAHIGKWSMLDDKIEMGKPETLIYDGNGRDSHLVGAMYALMGDDVAPPSNVFAGGNDVWHQHKGLCWTEDQKVLGKFGLQPGRKVVLGGEAATDQWCRQTMRGKVEEMSSLWMMHTWVIPGCTSFYGVFSHDLPYLTYRNYMGKKKAGCGSGLPTTAPLVGFENNELNIPGKLSAYKSSQLSWSGAGAANGPVAAELSEHPGEAHADGEAHLAGKLVTEQGFTGAAGDWPISLLRELDGTIHGTVTTPNGTVATFPTATAERTALGVKFTATATVPGGASVQLALEFADPGLRGWFLDAPASDAESLVIQHPAHGHAHAEGPVSFDLATHPGENHVGEEHLFGTAKTRTGFTGDAGDWTVSLVKNTTTKAITGYLKNPDKSKTFNFTVTTHHASDECAGGVHFESVGSEAATPSDPQNPELVVCDPAVTTFFADHDHGGNGETPTPTTPGGGHDHNH